MSDARSPPRSSAHETVGLGEVTPARSRHAGRRSAVALTDDRVVVGTADGAVRAFDRETLTERWRCDVGDAAIVAATPVAGGIAVGERGPDGIVRIHDAATGAVRWRYRSADDVGEPVDETRFQLPFVASLAAGDGRLYAAARRYERVDGDRQFRSRIYAFEPDGTLAWTYRADASPIAVDADGERVAVAYNRCPGTHQHGLVVLDAATGAARWKWDPGTDGDRRVGDVSLCEAGVVAASHGDYRGYRLGPGGREQWRADLATPVDRGDERLYAYPNHVHAADTGVVFVTGNTYAVDARETDGLHPDEHTAFGYTIDGTRRWRGPVGGFAGGVGADGGRVAVPGAQHFRERDPAAHGLRTFNAATGDGETLPAEGVVTAAALADDTAVAVEEPVAYHDGDGRLGAYRLHRYRL
ncbi:PQQ-binding-like beta-propeller repeat protein [Halosegnis sp.]|uniref:outer membrane protein assembly factor BamB family protein n=1 Tax=Halosegnis sp. TaxID=2864959 RepID=UPI0035D4F28D